MTSKTTTVSRLQSIDIFRGLTILAMVLVNNPGSWSAVYPPLLHASWHGLTPTDLVFPFFVFLVGFSLTLSRRLNHPMERCEFLVSIGWRAGKLFALGIFLALFFYDFKTPDYSWWQDTFQRVRIMGVLQRLALVYFSCALVQHMLAPRYWLWAALGFCVIYTLPMMFFSYPDDAGQSYRNLWLHGNSFAAWLDHQVLGPAHNYYRHSQPFSFDPEGLWSTLPAISTGLLGLWFGMRFAELKRDTTALKTMLTALALLFIAGMALHDFIPINKALWTPSYVALSAAFAMLMLLTLWWLYDRRGLHFGAKLFTAYGINAIGIYVATGVLARLLDILPIAGVSLKGHLVQTIGLLPLDPKQVSLTFALLFIAACTPLVLLCARRGWIWRV